MCHGPSRPTQRVPLLQQAGKPPLGEEHANPCALMGPDGSEDPKINRAEAQVPSVAPLGEDRVCLSALCRAPRFSAVLAAPQEPWEESSALPNLSLCPSSTQPRGWHRPVPTGQTLSARAGRGFDGWGPQAQDRPQTYPKPGGSSGLSPGWDTVMPALSLRRGVATERRMGRARGHSSSSGQGKEAAGLKLRLCSPGWNRCRVYERLSSV